MKKKPENEKMKPDTFSINAESSAYITMMANLVGKGNRSEGLRLILDEHKYLSARFVALGRSVSDPVEGEGVA